ncbi:mitochondrial transcription rescue factor 1 isoform X2 [Parasteatoda tepidariorum]|nr:uncharacterized protein LOC107454764 isoform X2 [Parasteatoda tepidariorum]
MEDDVIEDNYNITSRTIPSMRIDTVIKAALGVTKKKVEKEFYANNLRLNGALVSKKSINIGEGDEVDTVKGLSPDNDRFLLVDRVTVKSVGKVTGTGNYPVKFQVFKGLTIENYNDPWIKSSPNDPD